MCTISTSNLCYFLFRTHDQNSLQKKKIQTDNQKATNRLSETLHSSLVTARGMDTGFRKLDKSFSLTNIKLEKILGNYSESEKINREIMRNISASTKEIIETSKNQTNILVYLKDLNESFKTYENTFIKISQTFR